MKIAQVVPLWESVPPPKYGGTQRIAYEITEGLVRAGHDVTLFASGDSRTSAKLVSVYPRALYRDNISWDNYLYSFLNTVEVYDRAAQFDLIHCHIDRHTEYGAFPLAASSQTPTVFTLHFELPSTPERADRRIFLQRFKDLNYISISQSQRAPLPELNFVSTVYNGIDLSQITFQAQPGGYLVWLGRFSRSKGTKEAIEIAQATKRPLLLAGKLDSLNSADLQYYQTEVAPHLNNHSVIYVGELDNEGKNRLFAQAAALLNPIQWNEPFGLVPVEAMAAGVPVIATRQGSMPEIIQDGVTGFLVNSTEEAIAAVGKIPTLNRTSCRAHVENHFSTTRMVEGYQTVYRQLTTKVQGL